jgi:UDP-N-acetylmuramyl tripeptide synthase
MGLAFQMGLDPEQAIATVQTFSPLQGRMERISHDGKHYYFDISHSPDALDRSLQFLANVKATGRTIVVF